MKKLFALLLAVIMVLSLVACGGNTAPAATEAPAAEAPATEAPVEIDPVAAEAEIRYAISLLFDRNYIVEEIGQAGQLPASSFVALGLTDADGSQFYENAGPSDDYVGYYDVSKEAFEANYAEAYEILCKYYEVDENGMFTNFPVLTYLYNTNEAHKAIGEYLQSALAAVGITMNLENQEWATFLNTRKDGNYSIARNGWLGDFNDPISFLDMWTTISGNNDVQFGKGAHADVAAYSLDLTDLGYDVKVENGTWAETYDVIIGLIKTCTDMEVRFEMMHRAEDLLMSTNAIVPLYYYTDNYLINKDLDGVYVSPLGYKFFEASNVAGNTDTLSVCVGSEPDTLDPALNSAADGAIVLNHLFAGLAKWQPAEDGSLVLVADCAEELVEGVANEDGTMTYTYTLREGLKWSDGEPLTAADFEFAWKRAAAPETGADYGYMFDVIAGYDEGAIQVTALDERTLEVTLKNYVAYWNELMAFPTYYPVREDVVANEAWATDASTYVSNGEYTMASWNHNSVITMAKNENYVHADNVTMNEIKFFLSDDDNAQLVNWKNGDWLCIDSFPTAEIPALVAEYTGRTDVEDEYVVVGQLGTYYVCWNINEPLLP